MKIVHCEKCGGRTPEGFTLCPPCMREAEADENEVSAAVEILDIANIINIGETDASQRAAIESMLKIKKRLEVNAYEEKAKEKTPPKSKTTTSRTTEGKPLTKKH